MGKVKYEPPTGTFPYKISKRLDMLSVPRKYYLETGEDMPPRTPAGIRISAISGRIHDRSWDIAWPYLRRLVMVKRMYKSRFSQDRLDKIDRMIDAANSTIYSKLANCAIHIRKKETKDTKKKKPWSETEWKRHMEYIGQMAASKKVFEPEPVTRGESKPLEQLMPRIKVLVQQPDFKFYKRMSQEAWYRDPIKVPKTALTYKISDRVKKLAVAKPVHLD